MDVTVIADTHGLHEQLELPCGDMLVHAGDFTEFGDRADEETFVRWFSDQSYEHKIVIYGNHEIGFDQQRRMRFREDCFQRGITVMSNERQDVGGLTICALGFPVNQLQPGTDRYNGLTDDVDVLISHVPPKGILDESIDGSNYGDTLLRQALRRSSPDLHLFGHVHASYGRVEQQGTTYINAALKHDDELDEPFVVQVDK